jgi:hypothetical protein
VHTMSSEASRNIPNQWRILLRMLARNNTYESVMHLRPQKQFFKQCYMAI